MEQQLARAICLCSQLKSRHVARSNEAAAVSTYRDAYRESSSRKGRGCCRRRVGAGMEVVGVIPERDPTQKNTQSE